MSQRASRCGGTMPGKFDITKDKRGEWDCLINGGSDLGIG